MYVHVPLWSHLGLAINISKSGTRPPDTRRSMLIRRASDVRRTMILARLVHSGVLRSDVSISLYGACQLVFMHYFSFPWQVANRACHNNDRDVLIDGFIDRSAQIMGSLSVNLIFWTREWL